LAVLEAAAQGGAGGILLSVPVELLGFRAVAGVGRKRTGCR
jgi:hypothetical protein